MALTVRQMGQVAPPLKQKVDQFQEVIDNNDQTIERIKEKLASITPYREKLSTAVQQRQDDRRNLLATLARLEDALAAFTTESASLEAVIEELPRLLERIALPAAQPQGVQPGQMAMVDGMYGNGRRMPVVALDLPLPYFESLTKQFEARAIQVNERVRSIEGALATYSQKASGVPVTGQIESVIRSEYAQFRALATQLMEVASRLDQLRELAIRTKSVPAGMLVVPSEQEVQATAASQNISNSNLLTGTNMANQGAALFAPQMAQGGGMFGQNMGGGGMFGQNPGGGGMFGQNSGGGMFGQNPGGGGMFGQNSGGGLFGQNSGGGMFGQNSGGGMFGQNSGGGMFGQNSGGGLFGQNSGGGMFGQNSGGGMFGQNTGGGMFGQNTGGGMFGQNSGGGMFGQNSGGGMFGQNSGGGMFGQNTGGGMFGQNSGGGMFGQNSGGGMFGQNSGGGMFGQSSGGGMFGQNSGGGMFGQKTGGGMFGQNTGGGMFGQNTGGGLFGGGGF